MDIIRPEATWMFPEELKTLEPARINTIGWIVAQTPEHVTIASSLGDDRQLGDINCIPRSVIFEMELLSEATSNEETIDIPIL